MTTSDMHTGGIMALRLGVQAHHLYRLARQGRVPHIRVDQLYVFAESDESALREALSAAGYLKGAAGIPAAVGG